MGEDPRIGKKFAIVINQLPENHVLADFAKAVVGHRWAGTFFTDKRGAIYKIEGASTRQRLKICDPGLFGERCMGENRNSFCVGLYCIPEDCCTELFELKDEAELKDLCLHPTVKPPTPPLQPDA